MAARVERLRWTDIPLETIELPKATLQLTLGLGSGLSRRADGALFAVTDRGPNLFVSQAIDDYGLTGLEHLRSIRDAKIMPSPTSGPEIVELRVEGDAIRLVRRMPLRTRSGRRLGGAPPRGEMEQVFDVRGRPLTPDPLAADTEAIAAIADGSFFLVEEYAPSLLKADADGVVTERWVADGQAGALEHPDVLVRSVLPERAQQRRMNRGFEALCASADGRWLYAGFQSALQGEDEGSAPIWKLDARTGELAQEWLYPFDDPSTFRRDAARRKVGMGDLKVCEFAWAGEDRLIVLERIAHSTKLYRVDLARGVEKALLFSSDDYPEVGPDIEGMALLSADEVLIVSDNDFGVEGAETEFWRIGLESAI